MPEQPRISYWGTDLLSWYFDPLQEAGYHLNQQQFLKDSLEINCMGYALSHIQGTVRDRVRESIYCEARKFMRHDNALGRELSSIRGLMSESLIPSEEQEDYRLFMDWYRDEFEEIQALREQYYDDVLQAGEIAFSPPMSSTTVH